MTIKEMQKKRLNNYSKDELIEALLLSDAATVFVLQKCKEANGSKPKQDKKVKEVKDFVKEAPANEKDN